MNNALTMILLQATDGIGNYIMLGGMVVIFYLFFIRPQQKKQKDQKKFSEEISKGDAVVTMGGIHGKVVAVEESTVIIDIDRGTKLTIEKSSISLDASKKLIEKKD